MKFFRVACRIAWRELKASPSRFVFVVVAVAIGVGALSGVKGFGSAFGSMLFRNAKQLTASDLTAQVWSVPTADQFKKLQEMGERVGVEAVPLQHFRRLGGSGEPGHRPLRLP